MYPIIFQTDLFGLLSTPWPFHTYGLFIASGFLVAMSLVRRQAERERLDAEQVVDLTFYLLLAGLVGARLVFILTKWPDYAEHPLEMVMFWRGGLVWYGGFIAAAGYVASYTRRHRLDYFQVVDILIPFVAFAHGIGRLGCLAAGCCFGRPTPLPWGIHFPAGSLPQQAQAAAGLVGLAAPSVAVHPTQLYEAAAELALFWWLIWLRPRKHFHGQLFLTWLGAYAVLRSLIETFRGDAERGVYILSTSQWISIAVGLAALVLAALLQRRRAQLVPAV